MTLDIRRYDDPELKSYFTKETAAKLLDTKFSTISILYDLILLKYLNAPQDVEEIKVGNVTLSTHDFLVTRGKPMGFTLFMTESAVNALEPVIDSMNIEVKRPEKIDHVLSEHKISRNEFLLELERYLENPHGDLGVYSDKGTLFIYFKKPELYPSIKPAAIIDSSDKNFNNARLRLQDAYFERNEGDTELNVMGVSFPIEACRIKMTTDHLVQFCVDASQKENLEKLRYNITKSKSYTHAANESSGPTNKWNSIEEVSRYSKVPSVYIKHSFNKAVRKMLSDRTTQPNFVNGIGDMTVEYEGKKLVVPVSQIKPHPIMPSIRLHRDLIQPIADFFLNDVGIDSVRTKRGGTAKISR